MDKRPSPTITIIGVVVVLIATGLFVWGIMYKPAYGSSVVINRWVVTHQSPKHITIRLDILPAIGYGPHADWIGYTAPDHKHSPNVIDLPKNSDVTLIIHNYDSQTAPRNQYFSLVQGTIGGREQVTPYKESTRTVQVMNPQVMSHTFTIPDLGVSVPMMGVGDNAPATAYDIMKFTFRTHGAGKYRWQCIVPCGFGLYGFGGPMQELGYMDGLFVVS